MKPLTLALSAMAITFGVSGCVLHQEPSDLQSDATTIRADFPHQKEYVEILGSRMAYVDVGDGPVVLFIHGNPTSSYLWRNIIPHVSDTHRVIAVDLIGMGDSDQPDIDYSFSSHAVYLDSFIDELDLKNLTLVIHDWGSALGLDYAQRNEDNVVAIALMEAILPPGLPAADYEAIGQPASEMFRTLRTSGVGEKLVLDENFFVEKVLGELGTIRRMTRQEMNAYRAPFSTRSSRQPTLQWPRQIPIAGTPDDVTKIVQEYGEWFYETELPKLFFYATPGALLPPDASTYVIQNAKNLQAVNLGPGHHFLQEDHPHQIGKAISGWLDERQP